MFRRAARLESCAHREGFDLRRWMRSRRGDVARRPRNGITFDWSASPARSRKIVLAGGLDASQRCARRSIACGRGASTLAPRLETAPGIKDHEKVRQIHSKRAGSCHDDFATRCQRSLRTLRRTIRARSVDVAAGGTGAGYLEARADPAFQAELDDLLHNYAGRPTPLYYAKRLSERTLGGAKIYLKREDLLHTGAHKINNCLGQALLARRMGKKRIIAETGAGQHGVATATVCALFGFECVVYMGEEDMRRQRLNVFRMRMLGAKVVGVTNGSRTLKDAISEAMRDWVTNVATTHYLLGSALGAHPYPLMVRDFHRVIGVEARAQILEREGRLPDAIFACVGGGSNAIGIFHAVHRRRGREADRRRGGRPRRCAWANMRRGSPAGRRACCMARTAICCRMTTARSR